MDKSNPTPPETKAPEEDKPVHQRLRELFCAKFGEDWRRDITLSIRADALSWHVFLIEKGIEAMAKEFKSDLLTADKNLRPSEAAASLGSWTIDLENLLRKIETALAPPKPKESKPKSR